MAGMKIVDGAYKSGDALICAEHHMLLEFCECKRITRSIMRRTNPDAVSRHKDPVKDDLDVPHRR